METKRKVFYVIVKEGEIMTLMKSLDLKNMTRYPTFWMIVRVTIHYMKIRNMISGLMRIYMILRMIFKIKLSAI